MNFLKPILKINSWLATAAGVMVLVIGALTVFEAFIRSVFNAPTSWSFDVCSYILIWLFFLGSAYAYQTKGHVAVDFLRDFVEKRWGVKPKRILAFIGWAMALFVIIILLRAGFVLSQMAIARDQLTHSVTQIPIIWLYLPIVIGSVLMTLTLIYIIIEVIRGNEEYL